MHKYRLIFGSAMLAIVSVILQVYKIAFPIGVIDIDLVGVPWIIATFLFGTLGGLLASAVAALGIALYAPTGPVGAVMKFLATVVVVLVIGLIGKKFGFGLKPMLAAFALSLIVRPVLMTFFNYYWAIPVFFGVNPDIAFSSVPVPEFLAWAFPAAGANIAQALLVFIAIPNIILTVTDFWIAYALVFKTPLRKRLND
ncbi:MAG: ECF transporter S component [Candidatus Diapherotrites archaeon]|nr:ECF transporter S component [Candidatus Diapherotrites archaeon]